MVIHDDLIMVIYDIYIYFNYMYLFYLFYLFVSVEKILQKNHAAENHVSLGFYRSRSDRIGMLLDQLFGILQLVWWLGQPSEK